MPAIPKSPPPPLLFFACLLAGWGLGFSHPLALCLAGTVRWGLGGLLFLLAGSLGSWGLLTFRRQGTTHEPNGVPTAFLTSGPFCLSRNPLYLGLSLLLAALGLLLDSAWILGFTPVLVLLLDRLVIAREEVRLRALFGEEYLAYTRRVRRWL